MDFDLLEQEIKRFTPDGIFINIKYQYLAEAQSRFSEYEFIGISNESKKDYYVYIRF